MAIGSWVFDISAVMFVNCKITTNMCFSALGLTSYVCSGAQRSFHVWRVERYCQKKCWKVPFKGLREDVSARYFSLVRVWDSFVRRSARAKLDSSSFMTRVLFHLGILCVGFSHTTCFVHDQRSLETWSLDATSFDSHCHMNLKLHYDQKHKTKRKKAIQRLSFLLSIFRILFLNLPWNLRSKHSINFPLQPFDPPS